ncbi:MAG: hypothetical protein K2K53_04725 [Oscillospiraceae bacterium]|nr:hypothetical protein [Oscillospiraceae bacterium]
MKSLHKKVLCLVLAICLLVGLLPPQRVQAAGVNPAPSCNKHAQQYTNVQRWSETIKSHLYVNPSGGLTRVEYIDGKVFVEDYNNLFQIQSNRSIPMELPIWGGFFAGETYNFVIFGQKNEEQSNEKEVIRVVKYTKDWQRLGACSIKGANTYEPFASGSLRCAEYGGHLYVHTCHTMYNNDRDKSHHQASMTFHVDESTMGWGGFYSVGFSNQGYIYVSHSFNQFILINSEGHMVTLDHGDAYPRGLALFQNHAKAGQDKLYEMISDSPFNEDYGKYGDSVLAQKISGSTGANDTGVALGGFVETSSGYIIAYNYTSNYSNYHAPRELSMAYVDKETLSVRHWGFSSFPGAEGGNASNPQLVSTGLDSGYLLWQMMEPYDEWNHSGFESNPSVDKKVYYAQYKPTGGIGTVRDAVKVSACDAELSDCQPIVWNGKVVWYVTDNSVPMFYVLDDNGITPYIASAGAGAPAVNTAYPSTQAVLVDGKSVTFQTYALQDTLGNQTNYIRIRDIAYYLNGTKAQFEVGWDFGVNIIPGQPYTPNGSELTTPFSGSRTYKLDESATFVNRFWEPKLKPIILYDDNGGGYTYYKLRELGEVLGFNVSYINGQIVINTNEPYSDAQ